MLLPFVGTAWQVPSLPVRRFTVDEYHRMLQHGILADGEPFELLEGFIVPKMTRNPQHDIALELVDEALRGRLPGGWRLRIQSAITTDDSEPEPDLAVVRGDARSRGDRHPGPQDLGLVVEVADTSLAQDRQEKGRLYARAGIACYWIVNLVDRQVEVYTDPTGPGPSPAYRQRHDFAAGDAVPLVLEGNEVTRIAVAEFLP
jgi:Uma2 family endonuclease